MIRMHCFRWTSKPLLDDLVRVAAALPPSCDRRVGNAVVLKSFLTLVTVSFLAGCMAGALPRTYVLAVPVEPAPAVINEAGRPVIELPTVALPDYLDSTDILVRNGQNELTSSTTGRWGERLSLGITQALEVALGQRLPGVLVTHSSVPGQPSISLLVNVEAFDVHPDGQCVLTARWMIPGEDGQQATISQQGTFVTQAARSAGAPGPLSDAAIVSAMAAAVDQLADRIASGLRRSPERPR
jgi:uncharacterized protein